MPETHQCWFCEEGGLADIETVLELELGRGLLWFTDRKTGRVPRCRACRDFHQAQKWLSTGGAFTLVLIAFGVFDSGGGPTWRWLVPALIAGGVTVVAAIRRGIPDGRRAESTAADHPAILELEALGYHTLASRGYDS